MSNHHTARDELHPLHAKLEEQMQQIYVHYQDLACAVMANQIVSKREIETVMDGILVFCDDERFRMLYKKLCRHVYYQYPQLVVEHVNLFRWRFGENIHA